MRRPFKREIEAIMLFRASLRMPFPGQMMPTWRRRSKNSGGGIAPAAIGAFIEGTVCSVNAFRPPKSRGCPFRKRW